MAADIVQLGLCQRGRKLFSRRVAHTKPSFVTSVEARPPGTSFESTIIHDGPSLSSVSIAFA
jgi:hypothetical protein